MAETGTQQGIELTLKTGEVIKAPNFEEALKIAVGMAENTKDAFHTEKTKREELEQRMAAIEAANAEARRPKPADGQFDNEKYYKLLNDSPVAAANYVDSFRFGISDPNQVPATFQHLQTTVSVIEQQSMAAQFMQQHSKDFPQTPEAARALRAQFESLIQQGYPATVESLNMAYGQAVSDGRIKPLEEKEPEPETPPNPNLAGGGATGIDASELNKVENMNMQELEAYMKSKGLI
jgi:hypothetical protein